ncbi:hypothetical protein ZEAMMB73_Zm00001d006442 [Zea mays]|uniref:Uncharacterized protein n=1 Tax=Zea mays TaxID=4577 RepID=A0A1D6EWI7_MAIZE|nr:hypothetical protein ZEAMMB73_Zm00001d006442 [Zea mays]
MERPTLMRESHTSMVDLLIWTEGAPHESQQPTASAVGGAQDAPARCFCLRAVVRWSTHTKQRLEEEDGRWRCVVLGWRRGGRCHHRSQQHLSIAPPPGTPQHHDAIHVCSFNSEILKLVCSPVACVKLDSHASIGANYDKSLFLFLNSF